MQKPSPMVFFCRLSLDLSHKMWLKKFNPWPLVTICCICFKIDEPRTRHKPQQNQCSAGLSISATCTKRYRRMPATTSTRLNVSEMKTVSSPCRLRNMSIKVASSSSVSASASSSSSPPSSSSSSSSSQIWSLKLDLDIKYIYIILFYLYIYIYILHLFWMLTNNSSCCFKKCFSATPLHLSNIQLQIAVGFHVVQTCHQGVRPWPMDKPRLLGVPVAAKSQNSPAIMSEYIYIYI